MEKKIYAEPAMAVEFFTPKQYVASCDEWTPAEQIGTTFWADVINGQGYNYTYGPDGIIDNHTVEQFNEGHAPNGATGSQARILRGHWFENMTLYRDLTGGHFNEGTDRYNNGRIMQPITGYEDVAIYITKGGVAKVWIYTGNGGNKPTNPDWQDPSSTFKTMS